MRLSSIEQERSIYSNYSRLPRQKILAIKGLTCRKNNILASNELSRDMVRLSASSQRYSTSVFIWGGPETNA